MEHVHDMNPPGMMMMDHKPNNIIWVTGEIEDSTAKMFGERVLEITDRGGDKAPVLVLIDSDGGSLQALISMITWMDSVPNPFITAALGRASSAAAVLLGHGDTRFAAPMSRIMLHESSGAVGGHIDDGKTSMAEWDVLNGQMKGLLAKDMGMKLTKFEKLFTSKKRDLYLSAEEALKLNLIDMIGLPVLKEVTAPPSTVFEVHSFSKP